MLLQLQPHQAQGHPGGVNGGVEGPQDIGQRPNVVLVTMGEEDPPDSVLVLDEVTHVGDHHVDAVHVVIGEAHAHVHHDDVVSVLVDREVLADLIETAQGNDFQFFCHDNSFRWGWGREPRLVRGRRSRKTRPEKGLMPRRVLGGLRPPCPAGSDSPGAGVRARPGCVKARCMELRTSLCLRGQKTAPASNQLL